jgi:hypothetical protein
VVADRRPGQVLEASPAEVVGAQVIGVLAALVLGVAKGQDRGRPVLLDDPGGGEVGTSATGWAGDVTGGDEGVGRCGTGPDGEEQAGGGHGGPEPIGFHRGSFWHANYPTRQS